MYFAFQAELPFVPFRESPTVSRRKIGLSGLPATILARLVSGVPGLFVALAARVRLRRLERFSAVFSRYFFDGCLIVVYTGL